MNDTFTSVRPSLHSAVSWTNHENKGACTVSGKGTEGVPFVIEQRLSAQVSAGETYETVVTLKSGQELRYSAIKNEVVKKQVDQQIASSRLIMTSANLGFLYNYKNAANEDLVLKVDCTVDALGVTPVNTNEVIAGLASIGFQVLTNQLDAAH